MRKALLLVLLALLVSPGCCLITLHPFGKLVEAPSPPPTELPS